MSKLRLLAILCACVFVLNTSNANSASNPINDPVVSISAIDAGCVSSPLPTDPTEPYVKTLWVHGVGFRLDGIDVTAWRVPCSFTDSVVLLRIEPISDSPYVCSDAFAVRQGGVQSNSVKFTTSAGGSSFCGSLSAPQTFILDKTSFDAPFDDDAAFTLSWDGATGLELNVPAYVPPSTLVSAVLPSSRSVQVGSTASAFATIVNLGSTTATECGIAPMASLPVPAEFSYQTTDPSTNALIGTANTPVDIAAGALQTYLIAFTPTAELGGGDVELSYGCTNSTPAPVTRGVNTLNLSASSTPVPDLVALAATPTGDGTLRLTGVGGSGAFAVASVNVGSTGTIIATPQFLGVYLTNVAFSICETNPTTGACLGTAAASVTTTIAAGATPTFAIFVSAIGDVPFDPARHRVAVNFWYPGFPPLGSTSVAVTTAP